MTLGVELEHERRLRGSVVTRLLFPPWGWIRLWRGGGSVPMKLLGSIVFAVYSLVWIGAVLAVLIFVTPLELEWKGGFPPVPTFTKTVPDYDAVEAHRAGQRQVAPASLDRAPTNRQYSAYWTGFRGPNRDGCYAQGPIRTNWPAGGLPLLWRQPIGGGYASFALANGLAFTIEQRRQDEVLTAYSIETGREVWAHAYPAFFDESMGGEGPRATPTYDEGRIFALGATGEFHCLDAVNGEVLWRTNLLAANGAGNLYWAQSASPLISGDQVIVVPGGSRGRSVVAYDKRTGEFVWGARDEPAAYSSPVEVELAGRSQLVVSVLDHVLGLDPATGATLWSFPWVINQNNRNIAQPVVLGPERVLFSAGYGTGCLALGIVEQDGRLEARELWRNRFLKNKFTSSVLHEGHVYGLDEDRLTCLDAATGERRWKEGRYGYGQLILASGCLVILCGDGDLALVRANPDRHEELARFTAIPGKTWNHPALADGRLLVRNAVEMACYDISPTADR